MNQNSTPATSTWLGFELAGQTYAVPLAAVREVIRAEDPTPVPGAPNDVLGIINVRGSIVTVLDGCQRLGTRDSGADARQRLMIFHDERENVGMRIDTVQDMLELDAQEPMTQRGRRADGDPVLGVLDRDGGNITLLDADALCRPRAIASETST